MILFITGYLFTIPSLVIIITICCLWEHNENYFLAFVSEVFLIFVIFKIFMLPGNYLIYGCLAYLPIGFVYSFWKWFRYCNNIINETKEQKKVFDQTCNVDKNKKEKIKNIINDAQYDINIMEQWRMVVFWILTWPLSAIDLMLGDLYDMILIICQRVLKHGYELISNRFNQKLKELNNE